MEDLKRINYVFFGENIRPDIAEELNLDLFPRLEIKCSLNNKHNFVLGLDYINLYSKDEIDYSYSILDEFDYDLAVFVCNDSDKNSIDNLKNFKFEKDDGPKFAALQKNKKKKKFVDLKEYIKKKKVYPVVLGYHKMGARKLWEEDFESFAEELKGQSLFVINADFLWAIEEITKVALMQKFK